MHKLAVELNRILKNTIGHTLLSDLGRSLYFPKGVVAQSAEAEQSASLYNASVGMATLHRNPLYLDSIKAYLPKIPAKEIFEIVNQVFIDGCPVAKPRGWSSFARHRAQVARCRFWLNILGLIRNIWIFVLDK